ncbi:efflux RND transporter periplasmic adaptor subunit [Thermohalobacter berrensis]|uniref:CusB-like beta-barrel domain-containing protein n=1 Tax=Thermohalobacter berrensis TaxID=99594 RepID=A0A419T7S4_9FIRM|nr:efflux RND transporter periplasmic adaptor subunit [Thermohalobacter berrensis]RKD33495.1 hypothetical protein BET03_08905 [Thermohalobacter berrensis]
MKLNTKVLIITIVLGITIFLSFLFINGFAFTKSVEAYEVTKKDVLNTIITNGKIVPKKTIDIKSPISGHIKNVFVKEGDLVTKEDTIITFDKREITRKVEEARVSKELFEISLEKLLEYSYKSALEELKIVELNKKEQENEIERLSVLFENGAISSKEYEKFLNQYEQIKAKYNLAKMKVENLQSNGIQAKELRAKIKQANTILESTKLLKAKYDIKVPFKGNISKLYSKEGLFVTVGESLVTLEDLRELYVDIQLDEREISSLKIGQKALISSQAYPQQKINGVVDYISPSVDENRGTVDVKIKLENPPNNLKTGLTVSAEIITDSIKSALVIPKDFIEREDNSLYVWTVDNMDYAIKKKINAKFETIDAVIVDKGVTEGDIVLRPNNLEEGQKVKALIKE